MNAWAFSCMPFYANRRRIRIPRSRTSTKCLLSQTVPVQIPIQHDILYCIYRKSSWKRSQRPAGKTCSAAAASGLWLAMAGPMISAMVALTMSLPVRHGPLLVSSKDGTVTPCAPKICNIQNTFCGLIRFMLDPSLNKIFHSTWNDKFNSHDSLRLMTHQAFCKGHVNILVLDTDPWNIAMSPEPWPCPAKFAEGGKLTQKKDQQKKRKNPALESHGRLFCGGYYITLCNGKCQFYQKLDDDTQEKPTAEGIGFAWFC